MRAVKWAVVAVTMAGCNNFTVYQYAPRQAGPIPESHITTRAVELSAADPKAADVCPRSEFSALPAMPELPVNEIQALKKPTEHALDRIQLNHITELRIYIQNLKRQIQQERLAYQKACDQYQSEHPATQVVRRE